MGSIAYLNSRYPAMSHTFIEREVRGLRAIGIEVHTFSIRRPGADDCLGAAHEQAGRTTTYLLDGAAKLACAQLVYWLLHPLATLRGLFASQRLAPPGLRSRAKHIAFLCEAVRLVREMRSRGLRHVHVHMANNGAGVALLACKLAPELSYSLSIHGSAEFFNVESVALKRKVERATFVRCISNFCRAQIMAWTDPSCWDRLHVVHCGVDTDAYSPRPPRSPGPLRLLTVGRLHPIKGYELLLQACARLASEGLEWGLDMVGDGPQMQRLRELATSIGIADRVTFSGAVGQDRISEHFDRADVMVVSSFMEGVPVVLMEAMSKRLAVVATRVGGIPELVRDGVDGVLVAPGSIDELVDAIRPLAKDPAECHRFGRLARERIEADYSVDRLGGGMMQLFNRYLHNERAPSPNSNHSPIAHRSAAPVA